MLDVDRQIINALQGGFPISAHPFADAAQEIGLSEEALLARLSQMLDEKTLSRFGPMYNSEKMGGAVTLAAIAVPQDRFEDVTKIVNSYDEVAHNYQREHTLNMWFVVAAEDQVEIARVIDEIEEITGLEVLDMPKSEEYFLEMKLAL
jgi:DNA-binding Lrp family transcriptional regulator